MAVGRLKPVARISFWKELVLATFTVTGADIVVLPLDIARERRQRVGAVGRRRACPR